MRLWTLHPQYLDPPGLVAAWREALLARAVLRGRTRGYRSHPQLIRFRARPDPVASLNTYLHALYLEAQRRGYHFDPSRLGRVRSRRRIPVTSGQMEWEWRHLMRKLAIRNPAWSRRLRPTARPRAHPLFVVRQGPIQPWERGVTRRRGDAGRPRPDSRG